MRGRRIAIGAMRAPHPGLRPPLSTTGRGDWMELGAGTGPWCLLGRGAFGDQGYVVEVEDYVGVVAILAVVGGDFQGDFFG